MWSLWRHKSRALRAIGALGLTLTGWLLGTPLSLHAASSAQVGVSARILNPPDAVLDLTAAPVGLFNGDVQLVWTAPSNENGVGMDRYVVRFATFPASGPAQAETWWTALAASQRTVLSPHAPGVLEFATISGLTVGVTHYFGIKTIDLDGQISAVDVRVGTLVQARSLPLDLGGLVPSVPGPLSGIAQSTGSIQWQWGLSFGAGFYTFNTFPAGVLVTQTTLLQYLESGLTPNQPVARNVRAGNMSGLSLPTSVATVYTLAAAPSGLNVARLSAGDVDLAWNANGNAGGTLYRVERSLDNLNFAPQPLVSAPAFTDSGLTSLTTYYYRVRAINGDGIQTSTSSTLAVFVPSDILPPRAPMGLKGTLDDSGQTFTLIWDPVTLNADGTALTDLAGYHIYRSTAIGAPKVRLTTTPVSVPAFADLSGGQTFLYTVRAVDLLANESVDSLYADSSPEANVIFVAGDGLSSVQMPRDINNLLRSGFNKYGVSLSVVLIEEPVALEDAIVRSVRLVLVRGDTLAQITDLAFPLARATVAVGYGLVNGQVAVGSPAQAPQLAPGVTPEQLSLYWSNGVSWIKLGGVLDLARQTVGVRTAFLGQYQLRSAARASGLSLPRSNVYPRVFTPNGDGLNDRVYFVLENPNNASVRGEIFDRDGRSIATLPDPSTIGGIGTTLIWDGKDALGNVVPGGAYLYRIEGDGQTLTGTVGVAR